MANSEQQNAREIILDIFPILMVEIGFTKMTVQDILKKANVGRTTFYAHFTNKEDVLKHSVGRLRDGLLNAVKNNEHNHSANTRFPFIFYYFEHIISHHKVYDHLVGRDDFLIVEKYITRMLRELVGRELIDNKHTPAQQLHVELIIQHIVGAIWLSSMWGVERKQLSALQMTESFQMMINSGLEKSLQVL